MVQYNCCQPVIQSFLTDPTICPPGFNLPRRLWSTLNRLRAGQGRCAANLVRWHQASDPSYVETHDRQWIISSITVQSHDFLVVCGAYIKPIKTLFHGEHAKQATEEQEAVKIGFRSSFKVKLGLILALVRKVVTYFDN